MVVLLLVVAAARAACTAESPPHAVALVELYTSQRCTGCRPAEHWLSGLRRRFPREQVLPLVLHVDTWEYAGGRDPNARRGSERQSRLSLVQRMALVDTPHVLLQGREITTWRSGEFEEAVRQINARRARARLKVEIRDSPPGALAATVRAEIDDPRERADTALYLAAFQTREEDYVVLEWQGPLALPLNGRLVEERRLGLVPGGTADASGVAAFVQNHRTAEVLQAVLLPACSP